MFVNSPVSLFYYFSPFNKISLFRLDNLANVLRSAFRGGDIEWWDEDEEDVQQDEGSGDVFYDGEYTDDEDLANDHGSGDITDDEDLDDDDIIVPPWSYNKHVEAVDDKWNPWPKNPPTLSPSSTLSPSTPSLGTSGTSSVHIKNKMEVMKAVVTYLLPVVTCYAGGFLMDTPWIFQFQY